MPIPSMATDGVKLKYDPQFVESLSQFELIGVLAHETLHCANLHPWRIGNREQWRWNAAADFSINPIIQDCIDTNLRSPQQVVTMKLPQGVLLDDRFRNMSAEQIYELLPPTPQNQGGGGYGKGPGGIPSEMIGGVQPPPGAGDDSSDNGQGGGGHSPESLKADWEIATLQAAQAAKAMGRLPAGLERLIDSIKNPKVDWRAVLRRFVQECARNDYTWRQPSRRYIASGLYLPSLQSEQMSPIVLAVDASGSIGAKELQRFGSEMQSIVEECKPERVHVMWWDTKVHSVDTFEQGEPLVLKPKGGGGTAVGDVFDRIEKDCIEPACLIVLTDMMIMDLNSIQEPEYPTLWASTTRHYNAPFGEVIDISG